MEKSFTRRGFVGLAATAGMAAALAGCTSGSGSASKSGSASASAASTSASASAASASASAASASASAASASASAAAGKGTGAALRFVSGGEAGTYYALATLIAQHANANAGTNITAVSSDGSKANVLEIDDGTAQIGFCQSDVQAYAFEGTSTFKDLGAVTSFATVANLYQEQVQLVTVDENIKTVADLKGKNVSIGAAGSGTYFNAMDVLGAWGMSESDINPTFESFQNSVDSIKDGKIDAAFIVAGAPTSAVTDLFATKGGHLIPIEGPEAEALIAKAPYYSKDVVKADGKYKGQEADVATLSVGAVLIVANSVADDDVYALVSDIYENLEELAGQHDKFKEFTIEKGASVTAVPYHPGAAKYFAEKGITVATK